MWPLILVIAAAVVIAVILAKRPVNGKRTSKSGYSDFLAKTRKRTDISSADRSRLLHSARQSEWRK